MAKPSNNKTYTEDVVLNKILQDIANENLEPSKVSTLSSEGTNRYEDDLIKQYREEDVRKSRQKKIQILMILSVVCIVFILLFIITSSSGTPKAKTLVQKEIISTKETPKTENVLKSVKKETIEEVDINTAQKPEPTAAIALSYEKPVQSIKTEREIAKELLLQQMQQ